MLRYRWHFALEKTSPGFCLETGDKKALRILNFYAQTKQLQNNYFPVTGENHLREVDGMPLKAKTFQSDLKLNIFN